MTNVERMHEERINALDTRVEVLSQKVDDYIAEGREMRKKQNEEMKEFRADMKTLNQSMDNALHQIHNMTIATSLGVGAVAAAIIIALFTK